MSKTVIIYNKRGEVKKIKSNAGQTRHNRAAFELHRNNVEPFTRAKLARFFRRLYRRIRKKVIQYRARHYYKQAAAKVPAIGLIEG